MAVITEPMESMNSLLRRRAPVIAKLASTLCEGESISPSISRLSRDWKT